MTVQQLIDELQKIEDKTAIVKFWDEYQYLTVDKLSPQILDGEKSLELL